MTASDSRWGPFTDEELQVLQTLISLRQAVLEHLAYELKIEIDKRNAE